MDIAIKGWIHANPRKRRTALDWAYEVKWLLTESPYKKCSKIRFVQDNLNTHNISSLYKAFPAAEAREYARRLEFHFTPKHGSWLNIAEIAISVLSKQCIDRRISNMAQLNAEIAAWQDDYNSNLRPVNWQFTTYDARVKLRKLYPAF
ncbi:MAG: transposase [Oscillospiraceae bacterium]|nr:transposase [Oscillospiraceae bacterium]